MKLRIRGNSIRLRVTKTELAKIGETGKAEDSVRFTSQRSLRYGIEVRPTGAVTAAYDADSIVVTLPKARLELWLRDEEVSVEGSQPIGAGKVLQILLEKDYTCLKPRANEDASDMFANPQAGSPKKKRPPRG
jgi:hypothetical protein